MFKKILGIAVVATLSLPFALSASTDITHLTLDGQANTSVDAGDTVEAVLTYDLTSGDDAESASVEVLGTGLPKVCISGSDFADRIEDGTFSQSFDIDTTGATGGSNFDVRVIIYGTNGDGANQTCQGTGDDTMTFTDKLTVLDGNGSSGGGSGNSTLDSILASLTALIAKLNNPPTPPTPPASSVCSAYAQASSGSMQGVRNSANVRLQGFLLSQGASIPALAAGASFGFYGNQTAAAVAWFQSTNHCI